VVNENIKYNRENTKENHTGRASPDMREFTGGSRGELVLPFRSGGSWWFLGGDVCTAWLVGDMINANEGESVCCGCCGNRGGGDKGVGVSDGPACLFSGYDDDEFMGRMSSSSGC